MVDIKKLFFIIGLSLLVQLPASAQLSPRIAGLGDDTLYMELLEKESVLAFREDSLNRAITALRQEFRENRENITDRERYAAEILRLEGEIFDNRNETGIIAGRISAIEQDFIIANLTQDNHAVSDLEHKQQEVSARQSRNLVRNERFGNVLKWEDYLSLLRAQAYELNAWNFAKDYIKNYNAIKELAKVYIEVDNAPQADSIYEKYTALEQVNRVLADSLASRWDYIFDNKIYAYNYMLEKMNERETLQKLDDDIRAARDKTASVRENVASTQVYSYFIQKELLLNYEKSLAERLFLNLAADSLAQATKTFSTLASDIPKVDFQERYFLDYRAIDITNPSRYNSRNPIPPTEIHARGTIYRVLLGTYSRPQQISLFKGVYPLSVHKDESGKYNYYAGGFATAEEVGAAVDLLKKAGFRNPQPAVWINSDYSVIDITRKSVTQGAVGERIYNIEIRPEGGDLSEEIKTAVREFDGQKDISRIGTIFSVGPFDEAAEARELAEILRRADPQAQVDIKETIY